MKVSMPRFDQAAVLVVGDVMLDRYWHGGTSRISPEAPVPVVKVEQIEDRPGGAANVALNIAALGAPATLVGVTGQDEAADSGLGRNLGRDRALALGQDGGQSAPGAPRPPQRPLGPQEARCTLRARRQAGTAFARHRRVLDKTWRPPVRPYATGTHSPPSRPRSLG